MNAFHFEPDPLFEIYDRKVCQAFYSNSHAILQDAIFQFETIGNELFLRDAGAELIDEKEGLKLYRVRPDERIDFCLVY